MNDEEREQLELLERAVDEVADDIYDSKIQDRAQNFGLTLSDFMSHVVTELKARGQ